MKKILTALLVVIMAVLATACTNDSSSVNTEIDKLKERIAVLENEVVKINTNISSIGSILDKIQNNIHVSSLVKNDNGYIITFTDGTSVSIVNNADAPVIGIAKDTDGIYYWTITQGGSTKWLTDDSGNKIRVTGKDGVDGNNGITPLMTIDKEGYWCVSYDEGKTFSRIYDSAGMPISALGKDGKDGNSFFANVEQKDNKVIMTLANGTVITIPIYVPIGITFDAAEYGISAGSTIKVTYTLTGATDSTVVSAFTDGYYGVTVKRRSKSEGDIFVEAPKTYKDGYINVLVYDGISSTTLHVINFYEWKMQFQNGLNYTLSASGGTVSVPLSTNFDYDVVIPSEAKSWISFSGTKAESRNETLEFSVESNNSGSSRIAEISLTPKQSDNSYQKITISQSSSFTSMNLYGKWLENDSQTLYYIYNSDGTGKTWDTAYDEAEDTAQRFTWYLQNDDFLHIYIGEMGQEIPKDYTLKVLTSIALQYTDGYKTYSFTKK